MAKACPILASPAPLRQQQGIAVMLLVLLLTMAGLAAFLTYFKHEDIQGLKSTKTSEALGMAKQALLADAVSRSIIDPTTEELILDPTTKLPLLAKPYLSNPDMKTLPEGTESGNSGSEDFSLIGKLPWRSLGIVPQRDGDENCLWYVVSGRFKKSPPTKDTINWDTPGQIDLRDANGNLIATNLAALVIAPGKPLAGQDRSQLSASQTQCGGNYDARNYLDSYDTGNALAGVVNYFAADSLHRIAPDTLNKSFVIANNNFYNDQIVSLSVEELFRSYTRRNAFAAQVNKLLDTLIASAATVTIAGSKGTAGLDCTTSFTDVNYENFCKDWKEMLLLTQLTPASTITINGVITSSTCNRVLIFGGQRAAGQVRLTAADKANPLNYLEGVNAAHYNPTATVLDSPADFTGISTFNYRTPAADVMRCI